MVNQSSKFSAEEEIKLIEIVSRHPALYDFSCKDYKDDRLKENLWTEISNQLQKSSVQSKKKWKNIRDTYLRVRRTYRYCPGSAVTRTSKWPLLKHLNFLNSVPFRRRFRSKMKNIPIPSTDPIFTNMRTTAIASTGTLSTDIALTDTPSTDTPSTDAPSTDTQSTDTPSAQKRENSQGAAERNQSTQISNDENDPVLAFFRAVAMTVKTFPPHMILGAKRNIFDIVMELEAEMLATASSSHNTQDSDELSDTDEPRETRRRAPRRHVPVNETAVLEKDRRERRK